MVVTRLPSQRKHPTSVLCRTAGSWRIVSSSGAHPAQESVNISEFLPDLSELAPVHEGSVANVRPRTTSRAARLPGSAPPILGRIEQRKWDPSGVSGPCHGHPRGELARALVTA